PRAAPDEIFRFANQEELPLLASFGHERATLEARLDRGDRAFVMVRGSELLGYAWFCRDAYEEQSLGIRFRMGPGEIWLYDAMIARAHRRRRLYPTLLRAAAAALFAADVGRIWIAVEARNQNSIEAHVRGGARRIQTLDLVRILGICRLVAGGGGAPRWSAGPWPEVSTESIQRSLGARGPIAR